ncbi:putative vanillate O-demethylase oxidoreductase [Rhexocercosporidium sp. MPI-PUGE-AT-0058]|nr:putative vanillate O-demethylase oxidoreductase [Rhexocercosporidium sp. MPI-PUGE-AT-0058]
MKADAMIDRSSLARHVDTLLQVRTGKIKPVFTISEKSAIFKTALTAPVKVGKLGCDGDEQAFKSHGGPDKALMQYASQHYALWKEEIPQKAHLFTLGGFGENLVASKMSETTVCIGDIYRLGKELLIQVSEPRAPCYKLNHRFEVKDMSLRSQNLNRTGWYYRVLKEGMLEAGDEICLEERGYPQWTIANVQKFLYKDTRNEDAMKELSYLPKLGLETRTIFLNRLTKKLFKDDSGRLRGGEGEAIQWSPYKLIEKRKETPRISSFIFEATIPSDLVTNVKPGSHIRVKLGRDGKLVRAYSVVKGDSNRFELGIAFNKDASRGGSQYLHENVKTGDELQFSVIKSDFPLQENADAHILIAGGIGITAFLAAAKDLQDKRLHYHLYYAVRSCEDVAFSRYLDPLSEHLTILDGSKSQRLDIPKILSEAKTGTHVYTCGPDRLMSAVASTAEALSFPSSNIHFEAFTASTSGDPFEVELKSSGKVLEVKEEQNLLDVLREAGLDIGSSCEVGNCGTCKVAVCKGKVEHRGTGLMDSEKAGSMLSCVSRGIGRITIDF